MLKKPLPDVPFQTRHINTLNSSEIDIWSFGLNGPLPMNHADILSLDENTRADRFHFEHHRHHFRRARALLRLTLAHYLKCPPDTLNIDYGTHGKPYLPEHPELEFNLSHSGSEALLAIGKTHALGIDIEQFSERPYLGIGKHVFSDTENTQLESLPNRLKPMMFFNTWAQKEAFIKRLGLGLAYPTTKLTVDSLSKAEYEFTDPVHQQNSHMLPFMLQIGYAAAICYHPTVKKIYLSSTSRYFDAS